MNFCGKRGAWSCPSTGWASRVSTNLENGIVRGYVRMPSEVRINYCLWHATAYWFFGYSVRCACSISVSCGQTEHQLQDRSQLNKNEELRQCRPAKLCFACFWKIFNFVSDIGCEAVLQYAEMAIEFYWNFRGKHGKVGESKQSLVGILLNVTCFASLEPIM